MNITIFGVSEVGKQAVSSDRWGLKLGVCKTYFKKHLSAAQNQI